VSVTDGSKLRLEPREPDLAKLRSVNLACLQAREAHQVGAQTEARTLPRRQANARSHQIQQSERDRRNDSHRQDLLHLQLLLRDDKGRQRHREAL